MALKDLIFKRLPSPMIPSILEVLEPASDSAKMLLSPIRYINSRYLAASVLRVAEKHWISLTASFTVQIAVC